jgi:hypothetical protein
MHQGIFSGFHEIHDLGWVKRFQLPNGKMDAFQYRAGMRYCPNAECGGLVFVVSGDNTVTIYPPEVIDFDATNLPLEILRSLEEAIKCHAAGCYKASALMVRRVLEEVCKDKNATGDNLKKRIASLNTVAILPTELLNAADELRLLGNDAAHIEAKDYDNITDQESELAIELAKELLKAVYQYANLVNRLKALKNPNSKSP